VEKMRKLSLLFAFLFLVIPCSARIIYVDANTPDNNDGSSWDKAYEYLRDALTVAQSGDQIWVADGIYKPDEDTAHTGGTGDREATFQLINGVRLYGGYAGFSASDPNHRDPNIYETILSGDLDGNDVDVNDPCDLQYEPTRAKNSYHVVTGSGTDETAVLDGFTIIGGNANGPTHPNDYGGGIYNGRYSSPTITNCTLSGNSAEQGGGMYNDERSSPIVTHCTFIENSVEWGGGGMYNDELSSPTVTHCTFCENSAGFGGGGLYNWRSSSTLTNSTFSGNLSYGRDGGGAISIHQSLCIIYNCNITNNRAVKELGGGIFSHYSSPTITNCKITDNKAKGGGGGMCNYSGGNPTLTNCTFTRNSAYSGGGMCNLGNFSPTLTNCTFSDNWAIRGGGMYNSRSKPTLTNCILWGDEAPEEIYIRLGGTPVITYSNVQGGWPGEANIDDDPSFAFSDDYHLMPDSPCIDAGTNSPIGGLPTTDIDGNPRSLDGNGDANAITDMGAYEYNPQRASIAVSPSSLSFFYAQGWAKPLPQTLLIRKSGGGTLQWQIAEECNWLQAEPRNGISNGQVNEVTLSVNPNGLALGSYSCVLRVIDANASNSPVIIPVKFHIGQILRVPEDFFTIQAAIDAADDYDMVFVADGTYTGDGNRDIDFLGKAVTVRSENGPENCIIDCNGTETEPHRAFYFHRQENADSVLDGFTITNGYAPFDEEYWYGASGGGIYCHFSSPTITNCTFSSNFADEGGGMFNIASRPTITNCTFSSNFAYEGGGMFNLESSLRISNCTFSSNFAYIGSGMSNDSSSLTITNCTFIGNLRDSGMHNSLCKSTIINCTFSGNSAGRGGAIYDNHGSLILANSIFSGNSAEEYGGAIYNTNGSPILVNCTISGNAAERGGGLSTYESDTILTNCILCGNEALDGPQMYLKDESSAWLSHTNLQGGTGDVYVGPGCTLNWGLGNIDADPCFVQPRYLYPISYWKFDEGKGNIAYDSAGNNHGALEGDLQWVNGKVGSYALQFDGDGDYVNAGTMSNFGISMDEVTISVWLKSSTTDSKIDVLGVDNISANSTIIHLTLNENAYFERVPGNIYLFTRDEMGRRLSGAVTSNTGITDGNWHHLVVIFRKFRRIIEIYVDNVVQTVEYRHRELGTHFANFDRSLFIGSHSGSDAHDFIGLMDDVHIYNRVLYAEEIQQVYESGLSGHSYPDADNVDYHLLPSSPCIDTGDNYSVPADVTDLDGDGNTTEPIPFDLDGNPRIVDGNNDGIAVVDMGAYEFFIPPLEVTMKFTPQALNCDSKGKWVKAHLVLPEEFSPEDVDTNEPAVAELMGSEIESDHMNVFVNKDGLVEIEAAFGRADFCGAVTVYGPVEVIVVGRLTSGQYFSGTDTIRIINKSLQYLANLTSYWLDENCRRPDWCSGLDVDHSSSVDFIDFAIITDTWLWQE
jgi:parallel beta-helix repeat protein